MARVVEDYQPTKTGYELAAEYDRQLVTVNAIVKPNGITPGRPPATREQIEEMIRLYESGHALSKTGDCLGFSATTVRRLLPAAGRVTQKVELLVGNSLWKATSSVVVGLSPTLLRTAGTSFNCRLSRRLSLPRVLRT